MVLLENVEKTDERGTVIKCKLLLKCLRHPNTSNNSGINSIELKLDIPPATRKTKQINFRAMHKENHRSWQTPSKIVKLCHKYYWFSSCKYDK